MSFEKYCTPANAGFWGVERQKEEKCSIKEKAEIEHTYAALAIVAESQGMDITEPFKELYKECLYLRVLMNWQIFKPLTEEEKAAAEKAGTLIQLKPGEKRSFTVTTGLEK